MIKSIVATGSIAAFAATLTFAVPALVAPAQAAMTEQDCMKMWSQVDKDGDRSVSMKDAGAAWATKVRAVKAADTNKDGKLSAAEFLAACKKGAFDK